MALSKISDFSKDNSLKKIRFLFIILSGVLTGLMLVFTKLGFLEWITMIPVAAVLLVRASDKSIKLRSLYLDGFVFFYSFYLVCYHWFLYLYPLDFVDGMTKGGAVAVVLLAWLGLSLLQALMGGVVFVAAGIVFKSRFFERFEIFKPFLAAGLWAVFEWTQTIGWWGVPWGRLPIGQSEYIIGLQTASLFGSYFVTFLLVSVNFLLAFCLLKLKDVKAARLGVILACVLLVFQYTSGTAIYFSNNITKGEKIRVACIQGNIASAEKWNEDSMTKTVEVYTKYTVEAAKEGAQLVIWPETAIPYDISGAFGFYANMFCELAQKNQVYLLVGTYVTDENGNLLNSLVCFTPKGEQLDTVYSKRHLVPFGEYVPMRPLIETLVPPLAELVLSSDDIYAGKGAQIINLENGVALGGLICFDSIYEGLTLESVRAGAELICLSTNDSWFIDSAALNMHNAQAQIRAIESGKYVARAANTGVSTVINSRGEVLSELGALVDGKIVYDVYANDSSTLWCVIGNAFVYLLILIYAIIIGDIITFRILKKRKALDNVKIL